MSNQLSLTVENATAFRRTTGAYLLDREAQTLVSYDVDEARTTPVVVTSQCAHGPISPTDSAGRRIIPRCSDGQYVYGVTHNSAVNPPRDGVQRIPVVGGSWQKCNTSPDPFRVYELYYIARHGVLLGCVRASDGGTPYWYYSTDQGVTWTACQRDGGNDFAMHDPQAWAPWTVAQSPNGTVLIGAYQAGDMFRMYRSVDGVNFTTIDLRQTAGGPFANTRPDTGNSRHCHHMCYHAATGKWVAAWGDVGNCAIMVSTNDGVTWNFLRGTGHGQISYQPTWLFDIGHSGALLCGTDENRGLYLLHLTDGTIEQVWQYGDRRLSKCNKFIGWQHAGLYYLAGYVEQRIETAAYAIVLVSPDGLHWATHARLETQYLGVSWYGGVSGGTMLIGVDEEPGGYGTGNMIERAYQMPPARVALRSGLVLEPGVTNVAHTSGTAWTKSVSGWNTDGGAVQYRSGQSDAIEGGDYVQFPAGAPAASFLPYRTFALTGVGTDRWFHINAVSRHWGWKVHHVLALGKTGGGCNNPAFDSTHLTCDHGFAEYVGPPTRLDASQTNGIVSLQTFLTNIQGAAAPTEGWLDLDLLQVAEGPNVTWHTPNATRGHERIWWTMPAASEWTHACTVQPREPSRYLAVDTTRKLYLWSYRIDDNNNASLYYDCNDNKFKLSYMEEGSNGTLLTTAACHWWESYAGLRVVLRAEKSATKLTVQNSAGVVFTAVGTPMPSLLGVAFTLQNGDATDRSGTGATGQLPVIVAENTWWNRSWTDGEVDTASSLALLTPRGAGGGARYYEM